MHPQGPMTMQALISAYGLSLHAESLVWRRGMHDWKKLNEVAEVPHPSHKSAPNAAPPLHGMFFLSSAAVHSAAMALTSTFPFHSYFKLLRKITRSMS
jgi:hypothetical protein